MGWWRPKGKVPSYTYKAWILTWKESREPPDGHAPDDGAQDEGPHDDRAVGGQDVVTLSADRPLLYKLSV